MKLPEHISLVLTPTDVQNVLQALGQRIYVEVQHLIPLIQQQSEACVRAFNEPPVPEPAQLSLDLDAAE